MPRFGVKCSVRKLGGGRSEGVLEFREDIQLLVERGAEYPEYRKLVDVLRGEYEVREIDNDHPACCQCSTRLTSQHRRSGIGMASSMSVFSGLGRVRYSRNMRLLNNARNPVTR